PARHSGWSFHDAGLIPVQHGGRIKPLDSFAREVMLFETGSRAYQGWDPLDFLFSQISDPKSWDQLSFLQVGREDVRRQIGIDEKRTRFSPHELYGNFALAQYAERMSKGEQGSEPPVLAKPKGNPREQELRSVLDRLGAFRSVVSGEAWFVIPRANPAPWLPLAGNEPEGKTVRSRFVELLKAYQKGDRAEFEKQALMTRAEVEAEVPALSSSERNSLAAEAFYNHLRPFQWAWILYLTAALLWISVKWTGRQQLIRVAGIFTASAAFFHISGMALRCYIAGRPPVTNMYESIIWVSFGVVAFATIIYIIQKQWITLAVASVLAMFGLIAGDSAPAILDPSIRPLVPVLRSNYWLTIHVLTITLGYAAFALTLGLSNVTLYLFARGEKAKGPKLAQRVAAMNQLTYRAMQFGVVLLAAGTILGGVWADYSWGRFWGWDPKEVWALIALLSYLVILHARFTGWVGQFAYAAWSVVAFLSVVMAWYGVNFVLGVGLHSYGFSTGGRGSVFGFVMAQLAYVAMVAAIRWRREQGGPTRRVRAPA
ncbi:MAG: cytochrome c biogenesis protein, partial [Bdellovibrionota bacterium]